MKIVALVLAGGQSSRMGQDKALLCFEERPLIQRVCQVAAPLTSEVYILTPRPARYQGVLSSEYHFLEESRPGEGPLVAFDQGLREITADWILLLACDLPLLETSVLENWVAQLKDLSDSILALVPVQNSRWEPLCGFYRQQCQASLQDFIKQGGRSFQKWLNLISVLPLSLDSEQSKMLWNCNTPEEFKQLTSRIINP